MEAIGAGANVLAFVLLGLQLSRNIYQTLLAVKDGPTVVQQTANAVIQLHWILEQLRQSQAATRDVSLAGHMEMCVWELSSVAAGIEKLQFTASERKAGRLWKRFKSFLNEKSLDTIRGIIVQHAATLSLRLNIISTNIAYETKSDNLQFGQEIRTLGTAVQRQTELHDTNIHSLKDSLNTTLDSHENVMRSALSVVQEKVEASTSLAQSDASKMQDMLREIKSLVINHASRKDDLPMGNPDDLLRDDQCLKEPLGSQRDTHGSDQEMMQLITQLSELIHEKEETFDVYSDNDVEADNIIHTLEAIIDAARKHENTLHTFQQLLPTSSCPEHGERERTGFYRRLQRFRREFGRVELAINQGVQKQLLQGRITQQTHTYDTVDVGFGKLSLVTNKRTRSPITAEEDASPQHKNIIDYTMTLSFIPNDPNFPLLVASTWQQEIAKGTVNSISRLAVNRILPAGSTVFRLVREGLLRELQEMLQRGEASLRDHDEYGASLLFTYKAELKYSVQQPEMCKFLLEKGLDIDHVAVAMGYTGKKMDVGFLRSPLQLEWDDMNMEHQELLTVNKCRRLLLEAGADPTISPDGAANSFFQNVYTYGVNVGHIVGKPAQDKHTKYSQESIQLAWNTDLTGHFAHISDITNVLGESILLWLCKNNSGSGIRTKENFRHLLDLGADIRLRNDDGETCLHKFLATRDLDQIDVVETHEALTFLIESGADVYASNHEGITVSDIAYKNKTKWTGSYSGDLWDAVLQSCGYDIEVFRHQGHRRRPRKAEYIRFYSRAEFEELWKGREKLCPYWDDMPWPRWMAGGFEFGGLGEVDDETLVLVRNLYSGSDDEVYAEEVTREQGDEEN